MYGKFFSRFIFTEQKIKRKFNSKKNHWYFRPGKICQKDEIIMKAGL